MWCNLSDTQVRRTIPRFFVKSVCFFCDCAQIKIATSCSGGDTDNIITGGGGFAPGTDTSSGKTTEVSNSGITLSTAHAAAKVCIYLPSASGGSDAYADSGLTVMIRGTARYLVIKQTGYGFLAGATPTAATTPFIVDIQSTSSSSGSAISSDEQHGVTQIEATIVADPQVREISLFSSW